MTTRDALLTHLVHAVQSLTHPARVAVDGPPAAGKTTLADELAALLRGRGHPVVRATIDDYLHPPARRYARGEFTAESCYFDTHDHRRLSREVLDPLRPGDGVLIVDGVFLLRPELVDRWDLSIFVSVGLDRTVERAVVRESPTSTRADVERRWRERYLPAQRLYFTRDAPTERAHIVVHNDDPRHPAWTYRNGASSRPHRTGSSVNPADSPHNQ
ncbi:uridine kinase [Paractinoplanes abujensis]|uniref:Uridine kinase n=1 Tax=Paractinoplanes abujensis TaxID=882441 RepID=A0A7W7CND4_9ACTN|nr:uridylate kinase [Actinoplanes abujensis]MBB4691754.1 uridine kinase [Actinoplanes abujensis]GID16823.1 uridine kinase [Actinoplanes abujensis]